MKKYMKNIRQALCALLAAAMIVTAGGCANKELADEVANEEAAVTEALTEETAETDAVTPEETPEEVKPAESGMPEYEAFSLAFEAEGIKFSGDFNVSEKDKKFSQTYSLTGSKGTNAKVYIYGDEKGLKIGTDGKSGKHIYSLTFADFADKLAKSIFAPASGTDYALPQDTYDSIIESINEVSGAMSGKTDPSNEKIVKIFTDYAESHKPSEEKDKDADIGGKTVKADVSTYTIPKKDIQELFSQVIDEAMASADLAELGTDISPEEIKSEIMAVFDEIDDCTLKAVIYKKSGTDTVMKADIDLNLTVEGQAAIAYMHLLLGEDPANADKQSLSIGVTADAGEGMEPMEYSVDFEAKKTENSYTVDISMSENGSKTNLATLSAVKDGNNYTLTLEIPMAAMTGKVEGTIKSDDKSFELTVDRLSLVSGSSEVSYLPKGVVKASKNGVITDFDAEKDFLEITAEELDKLAEDIASDFEAVLAEVSEDSALASYTKKAETASANSYAKMAYTAAASAVTVMAIDDTKLSGTELTNKGTTLYFGNTEYDCADYLGEDFDGYIYGEFDAATYSIDYIVWSDSPISAANKRQLTSDEQEELVSQGVNIGCYPIG